MAENMITVGVLRERTPGERRVSMTPQSISRLMPHGTHVLVESGAGAQSWISDEEYIAAGAEVTTIDTIVDSAAVLTCVQPPPSAVLRTMHSPQILVGLLGSDTDPDLLVTLRAKSIVGWDLTRLPRTMSSAQSMDAMTSQDSVAGYKAVIIAAAAFGRYFPMMITAAGTSRPTRVLVLGVGIAGLQAIATARRLGADVSGYDIRPACRSEVESLGATFLALDSGLSSVGTDGHARALSAEEQSAQQHDVNSAIAVFDVVITTARVPGRRPPTLVTADALRRMRPGSVVVDMASSDLGGNVAGSVSGQSMSTPNGVSVIGAGSLPSSMSSDASAAYARNVAEVITHFIRERRLSIDPNDPIDAAIVVAGPSAPVLSATTLVGVAS